MRTIEGDLIGLALDGEFDVIAHGCNCMHTMGAGLAVAIRRQFPEAWQADLATARADRAKLGTCSVATVQAKFGELHVVNAYSQFDFQGPAPLVDYDAVAGCMGWMRARFGGQRFGLPLMGAGLAGGDWPTIEAIIARELAGENVTIVKFRSTA